LIPTIALVVVLAAPGLLGLVALVTRHRTLLLAAGSACLPLGLISIAALPLWIPGALLLLAFLRTAGPARLGPASAVITAMFVALLLIALGILVFRTGQYRYTYASGSQEGDFFLPDRAVVSLLITVGDLAATTAATAVGRHAG